MARRNKLTDDQIRWLGERHLEGYYITELAMFAGISRNHLTEHLARLGYIPRDRELLEPLEDRMNEFRAITEKMA